MLEESAHNDLILDERYKLRIASKRLKSGNYQVKFFASVKEETRDLYGYLLVDSDETLKGVIQKIRKRLKAIDLNEHPRFNLYNLRSEIFHEPDFMIFQ